MNIDLQARDFQLSDPLKQQIRQKLKNVLERFGERIRMVRVVLSDINGPKGGSDKRCVIKIDVNNHKTLVIDEVTSNIQESVHRCSRRAKHAISRLVGKNKKFNRDSVGQSTAQTSESQTDRALQEEFDFEFAYIENEKYFRNNTFSA